MTPTTIELAARRLLNAEGSKFWSSEEIIQNHLYFAALEMATETLCIENRYSTTSVASQQEYATPNRMISVKRVTYAGQKLKYISRLQLDSIDLNIDTVVTGTPLYYYNFDDVIGLHPVPTAAGDTIKIQSLDEPDVPTSSSTIEIPGQFHQYLVIGVAFYMSLKELGHPNTSRFEYMWNGPNNRNNALIKVRRSMRTRNRDQFSSVVREEDQPSTTLGMI